LLKNLSTFNNLEIKIPSSYKLLTIVLKVLTPFLNRG